MRTFSTPIAHAAAAILTLAVVGCSRPDSTPETAPAQTSEGTAPTPTATAAPASDQVDASAAADAQTRTTPNVDSTAGSGSAAERLSRVRANQQRQLRLTGPANGNPRQQLRLRDVPPGAQNPATVGNRTLRPTPAPMPTRAAPTPVEPPASNP